MEEELHKKGDFCDAQLLTTHSLSAKGPTLNSDLSICFGRASFVDRSKRKENVIMKLFVWLLQRVAEMVRNLVLIVSWPTLRQSSLRIFRRVRAFSYEPGNRAGSVTETNFVVCAYGKFQPGRPG